MAKKRNCAYKMYSTWVTVLRNILCLCISKGISYCILNVLYFTLDDWQTKKESPNMGVVPVRLSWEAAEADWLCGHRVQRHPLSPAVPWFHTARALAEINSLQNLPPPQPPHFITTADSCCDAEEFEKVFSLLSWSPSVRTCARIWQLYWMLGFICCNCCNGNKYNKNPFTSLQATAGWCRLLPLDILHQDLDLASRSFSFIPTNISLSE